MGPDFMLYFIFLCFNLCFGALRPTQVVQFEKKRVVPSQTVLPFKEIPGSFTIFSCSSECTSQNKNGACCTAFILGSDNSCQLFDYGPESYELMPPGDTSSPVIYVVKGFPYCLVAMLAGGWDVNINKVELYSPNGKCNVELTSLPVNLFAAHIITRYHDQIFVCAGHVPSVGDNRNCWKYNIAGNSWSLATSSVYTHAWRTPFLYNEFLYILDNTNPEKYSFIENKWSTGIAPPIFPGNQPCVEQYMDSIIILGGTSANTANQQYNFTTKLWTNLTPLPFGHQHFGCALLPSVTKRSTKPSPDQDKILLVNNVVNDNSATIYDITNKVFLPVPNTSQGHRHNNLIVLGQRVFVLTGWWGSPNTLVEEFHQYNNSWTVVPTRILFGRWHSSTVAVPAVWFKNLPGSCFGVI